MVDAQSRLQQNLNVINDHLDELRKWNNGGLNRELRDLDAVLECRATSLQTAAWLDGLSGRNGSLVRVLLDDSHVVSVREPIETILIQSESPIKGPSAEQVGPTFGLDGQVVNSTVVDIRQQIASLTSIPDTDQCQQPDNPNSVRKACGR